MDTVSPKPQSIGVKLHIPRQVIPARTIESIPDVLKHVRDHNITGKHLTQGEVAQKLKVPPITYRSWENGLRKPSDSAVASLVKFIRSHVRPDAKFAESPVKEANGNSKATNDLIKEVVKPKQQVGRGKKPTKPLAGKLVAATLNANKAKAAVAKAKLNDINAKIAQAIKGESPKAKAPAKKLAAKKAKK